MGRGSSSPPLAEVGPGGAVGQRWRFCRVVASRRVACLVAAAEGRLASLPDDDRRPAAPWLPGGGAGGGRLLSEGGKLGGQPGAGGLRARWAVCPGQRLPRPVWGWGSPLRRSRSAFSWRSVVGSVLWQPTGVGSSLGRRGGDLALTERGCRGSPARLWRGHTPWAGGALRGDPGGPPLLQTWASPPRTGALVTSQNESNCTCRPPFCCLYLFPPRSLPRLLLTASLSALSSKLPYVPVRKFTGVR